MAWDPPEHVDLDEVIEVAEEMGYLPVDLCSRNARIYVAATTEPRASGAFLFPAL